MKLFKFGEMKQIQIQPNVSLRYKGLEPKNRIDVQKTSSSTKKCKRALLFCFQVQNFLSTSRSTAEAVLENLTEATLNFFNPYRDKRSVARKKVLNRVDRWWEEESIQVIFFKKMGHSLPLFIYFRLFNTVDSKQVNKCSI